MRAAIYSVSRMYPLISQQAWRNNIRRVLPTATRVTILLMYLAFAEVAAAWERVPTPAAAPPGWIVINARARKLYFVLDERTAVRYAIAVPKKGMEWAGEARVSGKYIRPDWIPPANVKADHPELPNFIRGGSPRNPMGARAITLDRAQVAIHGTTSKMRRSIGTAASYGCIRMLNEDVIDLFDRVSIGTPVLMVP
jgi:lipoprotein-anchoring transpeptidase ErfK/SrfK